MIERVFLLISDGAFQIDISYLLFCLSDDPEKLLIPHNLSLTRLRHKSLAAAPAAVSSRRNLSVQSRPATIIRIGCDINT
jgi:hypothetical protein